jgi:hypothetical protein
LVFATADCWWHVGSSCRCITVWTLVVAPNFLGAVSPFPRSPPFRFVFSMATGGGDSGDFLGFGVVSSFCSSEWCLLGFDFALCAFPCSDFVSCFSISFVVSWRRLLLRWPVQLLLRRPAWLLARWLALFLARRLVRILVQLLASLGFGEVCVFSSSKSCLFGIH